MNHLVKGLLAKDALNAETVITAQYTIKERTGTFTTKVDQFRMTGLRQQLGEYFLDLAQLIGTISITIKANDVIALDGMDPFRYIDVYDINQDGSAKRVGKKRGRKPKCSA